MTTSADIKTALHRSAPGGGKTARRQYLQVLGGIFLFFAVAPFFVYPVFLMKVMSFALFAGSFNLLLAFGGLISFGHAAFFGVGAYVGAHVLKTFGFTPEFAILAAIAASAFLGFIFGVVAIRRQGIYFAMITLAFTQVVYFLAIQGGRWTNGEDGIHGIPRGRLFGLFDLGNPTTLYIFIFALFVGGMLLIYRVINSPFGKVCMAIRDNEQRAVSLGIHANRYKVGLFIISAALAGGAGAMKMLVFQLVSLADVHWMMSGEAILITLIGGLGTMAGPVIGALIIVALNTFLAEFGAWIALIQGLTFVLVVLVFPKGVAGVLADRLRRHF